MTVACSNNSQIAISDETSFSAEPSITLPSNNDNIFEISSTSFFFSDLEEKGGHNYSHDRDEWYDVLENQYGIKFKVTSLYTEKTSRLLGSVSMDAKKFKYISERIKEGSITGLMIVPIRSDVKKLMENELILPFNEYWDDNSNISSLPKEWIQAFSFNGITWGIPSTYEERYMLRYIRGDWLDELGLNMPTSIDELYEVMLAFTIGDPDKDNKSNTVGAVYDGVNGLADIFASYDLRTFKGAYFGPQWNPSSDIWEDALLKAEMPQCIAFLRMCIDEGLMTNEVIENGYNDFERGFAGTYESSSMKFKYATAPIATFREGTYSARIEAIPGLTNVIKENINGYYTLYGQPYVLTKNTEYPKSTVNNLINIFTIDLRGSLLGNFGAPNNGYEIIENMVFYKTINTGSSYIDYEGPWIIRNNPVQTYVIEPDYKRNYANSSQSIDVKVYDYLKNSNLMYKIPFDKMFPDYLNDDMHRNHVDIKVLSMNYVKMVLNGFMTYEDALEEYRKQAKKMGAQELMDYLNSLLDKPSTQEY